MDKEKEKVKAALATISGRDELSDKQLSLLGYDPYRKIPKYELLEQAERIILDAIFAR